MSEWKSWSKLISEYNHEIDTLSKRLDEDRSLPPNERARLTTQLNDLIYSVASMRPYAEKERQRKGDS